MKNKSLYLVSFIEGGTVMVTEIAGAKLLSPFFGTSIYSWASTLSITLFALMVGYFAGGYLTTKPKFQTADKIVWIFLLSGILVMLMPLLARYIMTETLSFSFFPGLFVSQTLFLLPPIFLMAMISPMIIYQITLKAEESGQTAGSIYALSTCGGIVFTLLIGFFVIPEYGISNPVQLTGLGVCIIAMTLLGWQKFTAGRLAAFAGVLAIAACVVLRHPRLPELDKLTIHERSEGLLGELTVVDQLGRSPDGRAMKMRTLRTNNVQQNSVLTYMPTQSLLYYVNFTRQLLKTFPERNSALLVGLGAGSLYKAMTDQYKTVTSVELDKRIYDYGVRYFGMAEHDNVIDDGRHFINTCHEKYDLIMLDVIVGEIVPEQMISVESFKKCYDLLNDKGMMIIENGAVLDFGNNSFAPSIARTLEAAGFHVSLFNPVRSDQYGDIVFVASKNEFDYSKLSINGDLLVQGGPLPGYALSLNTFDLEHARLLTDDKNYADKLLKDHYLTARQLIREYMGQELAYMSAAQAQQPRQH